MKKFILSLFAFVMSCSVGWAVETPGNGYNQYGVKCWVDRDNTIQYVDVQIAGGFADFVNNGGFDNFNTRTTYT